MSNQTVGPLQLQGFTMEEMNRTLRLIQGHLDTLFGLKGVVTVYDRVRASAPVDAGDVVVSPATSSHLPSTIVYTDVAATITALHTFDLDPAAPFAVSSGSAVVANLDADKLDGLSSAAFLILAGQAGGQTAAGGTVASENLILKSTAHATKGKVAITDLSPFKWEDVNGVVIHQFGA